MQFPRLLATIILFSFANAQSLCNTTISGSTITNGYDNFNVDLSLNSSYISNSIITFSTCSVDTNFDTYLSLYNDDATKIIKSCDDYCSPTFQPCLANSVDGRFSHHTIMDVHLNNLTETNYILQIRGYQGNIGSYKLIMSFNCDDDISINEIAPNTASPTDITQSSSMNVNVESDEQTDGIDDEGNIKLIVTIVGLSILYCFTCCFWSIQCKKEDLVSAQQIFYDHQRVARLIKILSQVVIAILSILASLALSDSLGLANYDNGLIAISMGSISFILSCWKFMATFGDFQKQFGDTNTAQYGILVLGGTIMGATITDSVFDAFQGIAALRDEEYTSLSATMLVTATWLGVGEEVIEGIFEIGSIFFIECMEKMGDSASVGFVRGMVNIVIHIGGIVELSMGIYIFSTFEESAFKYVALVIQSIFLLFATVWICFAAYIWNM